MHLKLSELRSTHLPEEAVTTMAETRQHEHPISHSSNIDNDHRHDIELQNITSQEREREQIILPPTDGGYQAWLLLAGCFVINVLIWGPQHFFVISTTLYILTGNFRFRILLWRSARVLLHSCTLLISSSGHSDDWHSRYWAYVLAYADLLLRTAALASLKAL